MLEAAALCAGGCNHCVLEVATIVRAATLRGRYPRASVLSPRRSECTRCYSTQERSAGYSTKEWSAGTGEVLAAAHKGFVGSQVPHGKVAVRETEHQLAHLAMIGRGV